MPNEVSLEVQQGCAEGDKVVPTNTPVSELDKVHQLKNTQQLCDNCRQCEDVHLPFTPHFASLEL